MKLRATQNKCNPGTTADLTASALGSLHSLRIQTLTYNYRRRCFEKDFKTFQVSLKVYVFESHCKHVRSRRFWVWEIWWRHYLCCSCCDSACNWQRYLTRVKFACDSHGLATIFPVTWLRKLLLMLFSPEAQALLQVNSIFQVSKIKLLREEKSTLLVSAALCCRRLFGRCFSFQVVC